MPGDGAAVARPVVLVRYRPGVAGATARTVHAIPLPADEQAGAVGAACGAVLLLEDIETVTSGAGMPCTVCVATHAVAGATAAGSHSRAALTVPPPPSWQSEQSATSSGASR